MLPGEFLTFISDKIKNWTNEEREDAKFLTTWALSACGATHKTGAGKSTSQLGHPLGEFDLGGEEFDDWADARLDQTLGVRVTNPVFGGGGGGYGGGVGFGKVDSWMTKNVTVSKLLVPHVWLNTGTIFDGQLVKHFP